VPAIDAPTRTSTSHTLVVSEVPVEGEESSPPQQNIDAPIPPASPLVPSSKRARVETIMEPTLQLGSSSTPLLDDVSPQLFSDVVDDFISCFFLILCYRTLFFLPTFSFSIFLVIAFD
jgi:hypothetical protein